MVFKKYDLLMQAIDLQYSLLIVEHLSKRWSLFNGFARAYDSGEDAKTNSGKLKKYQQV